jgi:hypothetical protein
MGGGAIPTDIFTEKVAACDVPSPTKNAITMSSKIVRPEPNVQDDRIWLWWAGLLNPPDEFVSETSFGFSMAFFPLSRPGIQGTPPVYDRGAFRTIPALTKNKI